MKYIVLVLFVMLSGCASIVSGTRQDVSINSVPTNATVTVVDEEGRTVFNGRTPAYMELKRGNGFFSGERYTVSVTKDDHEPNTFVLDTKLNLWYFGNLILGGWPGMLIVDPLTGAMWSLDDDTYINLVPVAQKDKNFCVVDINQVPEEAKAKMKKLK